MNNFVKEAARKFIPQSIFNQLNNWHQQQLFKKWINNGCPVPPPHIVKQKIIAEYQEKYGHSVLVETGTYWGDMVEAQKKRFKKIITIELSEELVLKAKKRFRDDANVSILQGDSGKVLPQVVENLKEPAIFWLDGHYSAGITTKGEKECPIFEELNSIFKSDIKKHIFLIDDARDFNGHGDYPTIQQLTEFIKSKNNNYSIEVKDDVIRCTA